MTYELMLFFTGCVLGSFLGATIAAFIFVRKFC